MSNSKYMGIAEILEAIRSGENTQKKLQIRFCRTNPNNPEELHKLIPQSTISETLKKLEKLELILITPYKINQTNTLREIFYKVNNEKMIYVIYLTLFEGKTDYFQEELKELKIKFKISKLHKVLIEAFLKHQIIKPVYVDLRKEDYSIYDLGQHNLHYNANVKRSRPLEDYSIEYARWFLVYQFKILNSIQNKQGNTITLDQNTKDFFEAVSRFKNLLGTNYNFFPPHIEKELEKAIKVTNK